jgi:hypothetical protein
MKLSVQQNILKLVNKNEIKQLNSIFYLTKLRIKDCKNKSKEKIENIQIFS